ncbi:MAG: energy-coupling factor transporter transmembrane protein EcfT [Lachnospiraceae bacterium]|nr:energy-coupling factor transporter transmembrane protein EcfT [Lachnospiraceae bacterium]
MSVNERFMKINRSKIRPGFLTGRHPVSLLVFFVCVTGISMFSKNPAVLFMSMFFSITSLAKLKGLGGMLRFLRTMLVLALLTAVINPLFNHRGRTVLARFHNGQPLTLEACFYGLYAAMILISVLAWFSCFNHCFDTDKLLYLFGRFSPRLSLMLSMSLRFVPEFAAKAKEISGIQRMLAGGNRGIIQKIKNGTAVFGSLLTWVLEGSVMRSESMRMRGYGVAKRKMYSAYKWEAEDTAFTALSLVFTGIYLALLYAGSFKFWFYPYVYGRIFAPQAVAGYLTLALLMCLPLIFDNRLEGRRIREHA